MELIFGAGKLDRRVREVGSRWDSHDARACGGEPPWVRPGCRIESNRPRRIGASVLFRLAEPFAATFYRGLYRTACPVPTREIGNRAHCVWCGALPGGGMSGIARVRGELERLELGGLVADFGGPLGVLLGRRFLVPLPQ